MSDATFARPDLTAFARLDELGLEVVGQRVDPDRAVLACRVVEPDQWCRRCGCQGAPRDTVIRRLAHEPLGWRPTTLLVTVRRYRCTGCGHVWRQDTSSAAEPRAKLSRRGLRWALEAIVCQHLTVARVAEGLAVSWNTANDAVLALVRAEADDMTSMTRDRRPVTALPASIELVGPVTGGVDTHGQTHHAAVIDLVGRLVGDREFDTTPAGYRALSLWLRSHGVPLDRVGVEGSGAYGAGLARHLRTEGVTLVEVDRPDRSTRRSKGKSDPIDAYAAARAALSGTATGAPKTRDGRVEAIRTLRLAKRSAIKARTQAMNQLHAALLTGPAELREQLRAHTGQRLVGTCTRLRQPVTGHDLAAMPDPIPAATKSTLRRLAPPPPAAERRDQRYRRRSAPAGRRDRTCTACSQRCRRRSRCAAVGHGR